MSDLKGKRIALIIADKGFRDEEFDIPFQIFKKHGAEVKTASSLPGMAVGKLGMTVTPDILYSDIKPGDYDALVFVGGPGAVQYWNDSRAHKLAKDAYSAGKVVAAICAAPVTLANAGLLNGKRATCFPSDNEHLKAGGATYTARDVEIDGKIVTGNGPQSAEAFALAIEKLLAG